MTLKITVTGKGGEGKTTLSGLIKDKLDSLQIGNTRTMGFQDTIEIHDSQFAFERIIKSRKQEED